MSYLLGQILLCLLLAGVLGLVLGWFLRGMRQRADIDRLNSDLQGHELRLKESEHDNDVLRQSLKDLEYAFHKEQEQSKARIQQLEPFRAEATWLRQELNNSNTEKNAEIDKLCADVNALRPFVHETRVNETVVERLHSQLRTQAEAKESQVQQLKSRLGECVSKQIRLEADNQSLINSLQRQCAEVEELQGKLRRLQGQANSEVRTLHRRLVVQDLLQQTINEQQRTIDELKKKRGKPNKITPAGGYARAAKARVVRIQRAARDLERSKHLEPEEQDDLKRIRGIGPVMERVLNGMGVTSFRQVAKFTAADVKRVQTAIDRFPDRIVRDDWMGGARREYEKKYGDKL